MKQNWLNFRKKLARFLRSVAVRIYPEPVFVSAETLPVPAGPTMEEIFSALKINRLLSGAQSAAVPDRVVITERGAAFKSYRSHTPTMRDITSIGFGQSELTQVQLVQSLIALGVTDIEIK